MRTGWREDATRKDGSMATCIWAVSKAARLPCLLRSEEKSRGVRIRPWRRAEVTRVTGLGKQHGTHIWNSPVTWLGDIEILVD